jgi:hypothetical protein
VHFLIVAAEHGNGAAGAELSVIWMGSHHQQRAN